MRGLDKFREYMSGFRSHYVVIGGVATVLTLQDKGLPARATKDVDMIIICQPESKFYMRRFWEFIKAGGYKLWKPDDEEGTGSPLTRKILTSIRKMCIVWHTCLTEVNALRSTTQSRND